jgi:uncharacterized protein YidB (DUF937 family)
MGLLDKALDMFGGQQALDPKTRLLQAALALLANNGQTGGLQGLVGRFQEAGLGNVIDSWIGRGQNVPVSGEQIQQALGDGPLEQISQETGMTEHETAHHLSDMLPDLVDRLTPEGQAPPDGLGNVASLLERVLGKF